MAKKNEKNFVGESILDSIKSPDDLKALPESKMTDLAEEIRAYLVEHVSETGGHLASNLGAVELSLAIHRVFSTPYDHVIFDVGHQCYVHKMMTGRTDRFSTLRQSGGMSGFPKRTESEHDAFGTGHSSTSLSAALGFAEADRLSGSDAYTVCVIGDGAYTGGMIHEALNNCRKHLRLIIILNENEMSISKNIGRFAKELSHLRASKGYFKTKRTVSSVLSHLPLIGKYLIRLIQRVKTLVKNALYGSNMFERLGIFYFGPVDGNDEDALEKVLREAKLSGESCVIHVKTKKGKGYPDAEERPDIYHGMSPRGSAVANPEETFSNQMGANLCRMAESDPRICAITAAMADGTGLDGFRKAYKERFFDVGIAEEHAVTFAAGLAANGYRPAVAIYSTFLQRAYDNIIHDVELQRLPVTFFIDRAGMNLADGPTHYGVFDVAFLSQLPDMPIYTPVTKDALRNAMNEAYASDRAVAIRYPNGVENPRVVEAFYGNADPACIGIRGDFLQKGESAEALDCVIVTHGRIVCEAMKAAELLLAEGLRVGILLLEKIAPYASVAADVERYLPRKASVVLFLEEEIRTGGMGMLLSEALKPYDVMQNKTVRVMALDNPFAIPAKGQNCFECAGLDAESIAREIRAAAAELPMLKK